MNQTPGTNFYSKDDYDLAKKYVIGSNVVWVHFDKNTEAKKYTAHSVFLKDEQ